MRRTICLALLALGMAGGLLAQEAATGSSPSNLLRFDEILAIVQQEHPIAKQADLKLIEGSAEVLRARGAFDPTALVKNSQKELKDTEYYDEWSAVLEIPTWYGIELQMGFEDNTGEFLNPDQTVPDGGLYSAGISVSVLEGLLIDERRSTLRQAQQYELQTQAQRTQLINQLIYDAGTAYLNWLETAREEDIYRNFVENAKVRLEGVSRAVQAGETAAIDSVEAGIALQNRQLSLEAATLKRQKAALIMSNFLWSEGVPVQLAEDARPALPLNEQWMLLLNIDPSAGLGNWLENHPKILEMDAKIQGLEVNQRYKKNKLLPELDVYYAFLNPEATPLSGYNTANYQAGLSFKLPLFLRKERGEYQLAQQKLEVAQFENAAVRLGLVNKADANLLAIESLTRQKEQIVGIVSDYRRMMQAEERKFELGESSLFLINTREALLIRSELKANELEIDQLGAYLDLFNVLGLETVANP